jgi:hypothetical protein
MTAEVLRHPGRWGLTAGLLSAAWAGVVFNLWLVTLLTGVAAGLLSWLLWREGGPGRRWSERRYDDDGVLREEFRRDRT